MSDVMYGVLAMSVAFNLYLMHRLIDANNALRNVDRILRAVANDKAKIVRKNDGDWTVERTK